MKINFDPYIPTHKTFDDFYKFPTKGDENKQRRVNDLIQERQNKFKEYQSMQKELSTDFAQERYELNRRLAAEIYEIDLQLEITHADKHTFAGADVLFVERE